MANPVALRSVVYFYRIDFCPIVRSGNLQRDCCSSAECALDFDVAAMQIDDFAHDAYAQPGTGNLAGSVGAVEAFANASELLRSHADAMVGNTDARL